MPTTSEINETQALYLCRKVKDGVFVPVFLISPIEDVLDSAQAVPIRSDGLPHNWSRWPEKRQKATRIGKNSPLMERISRWFNRRVTTPWSVAEAGALSMIDPLPDEVDALERFYLAVIPPQEDYRRRDLQTLLNNWNGELDKAQAWTPKK